MSKRNRKDREQRDDVDVTQQKNVDDEGNTGSNKVMDLDAPLPRPKRRKRRAKADRGLPPDSELRQLAEAYLDRQHKHWPNLVVAGILPSKSDTVIFEMVEDFKLRRRTRSVNVGVIRALAKACSKSGGNYRRCHGPHPLAAPHVRLPRDGVVQPLSHGSERTIAIALASLITSDLRRFLCLA